MYVRYARTFRMYCVCVLHMLFRLCMYAIYVCCVCMYVCICFSVLHCVGTYVMIVCLCVCMYVLYVCMSGM